jgi:hypothetical protein
MSYQRPEFGPTRKKATIPRVLLKPWARIGAHRVR